MLISKKLIAGLLLAAAVIGGQASAAVTTISIAAATDPTPAPAVSTFTIDTQNPNQLSGYWSDPKNAGFGLHVWQSGDTLAAAWYVADIAKGDLATRYVLTGCKVIGMSNQCTGTVYFVKGGLTPASTSFSGNWNNPDPTTAVGTGTLKFSDLNNGSFSANLLAGVGRSTLSAAIQRSPTGGAPAQPAQVNHGGVWGDAFDPTWSVFLVQQGATLVAFLSTDDAFGNPIHYVATTLTNTPTSCGDLYHGHIYRFYSSGNMGVGEVNAMTPVGTVTFSFNSNGCVGDGDVMSYTIDNQNGGLKNIFKTSAPGHRQHR